MQGLQNWIQTLSLSCIFMVSISSIAKAASIPPKPKFLDRSKQLIVVIPDSWDDYQAQLQLFERADLKQPWHSTGKSWRVVVGQKGVGWADTLKAYADVGEPIKKEGDKKAPAGAFQIKLAFGFSPTSDSPFKFPYLALTPSIVCVDDVKSQYYGKIIDSTKVTKDWNSAEMMADYAGYKQGFVVDYNTDGKLLGAGSCIFIHIKADQDPHGTAGCTAMVTSYLSELWNWLDPKANPVLVQFPQAQYAKIETSWDLPPLLTHTK